MTKELIERCGRSYDRVAGLTKAQDSEWLSLDLGTIEAVARYIAARETDPADRRRTMVLASADGHQLVERLHRSRREQFAGWFEQMDESDLHALERGLDALASVIERGSGER